MALNGLNIYVSVLWRPSKKWNIFVKGSALLNEFSAIP